MTTLFHAIADGSDRLRFGEDALIWRLRAEGHAGPFPCEACSDPEWCIEGAVCERVGSGADDAEEAA